MGVRVILVGTKVGVCVCTLGVFALRNGRERSTFGVVQARGGNLRNAWNMRSSKDAS